MFVGVYVYVESYVMYELPREGMGYLRDERVSESEYIGLRCVKKRLFVGVETSLPGHCGA